MVFGIAIVLLSGLVVIAVDPASPGREILAVAFGIGAALTLDEFALWLYLRDVYWCPEGRSSIDATLMGVLLAALLLVGTSPFGIQGSGGEGRLIAFAMIAFNVAVALVTFMEGKLALGMASVFIPVIGLVGAVRLAKPRSLWAKWLYGRNEQKLARARARYGTWSRYARLRERVDDLVGGAPSFGMMAMFRPQVGGGRLMTEAGRRAGVVPPPRSPVPHPATRG